MFFAEDHVNRCTASCVFASFAFVVPVEPLRKVCGYTRIETFIFAFKDIDIPHALSIHFFDRCWPFVGNFLPVKIPSSGPVIKKPRA